MRALIELQASEGWKILLEHWREQVSANKRRTFNAGIRSLDGAFEASSTMGVIEGTQLAILTPEWLIEEARTEHDSLLEKLRDQDG